MSKGRKTPLDALHFHPPAHPPHVSYLSHYKKGTQHVLYWHWTLALEEDRVRQILSIFISPRDTALHHLSFSRAAPRAWMTIVNASTSDITKLYFSTSVSVSFLTFTSYIWCLNAVFSLRFSTMVVSGSVCSSLRVLACWQWGRECSDMNTSASWLLSALEDNPPTLAMLMQRIWRASASRRSFHATRRTPPSHLCGIVIVFPDIWWCPWQLGGLAWGLLSCPGLGNITGWDVKSLIQTFFFLFSVTWERLSECKAEPMRKKKKDHKLYLVLLIERGSSEIASTPFLKASPPVSCVPVPSTSCRQLGCFFCFCLSENFLFHEPFSIRSPQSSALIVLMKWRTSAGDQAGWKLNPFLPPPGQDFLVRITHNFSKLKLTIYQHILTPSVSDTACLVSGLTFQTDSFALEGVCGWVSTNAFHATSD